MKNICLRHIATIKNLEEDLHENIEHYKETGDDGNLIDSCLDQLLQVIYGAPDVAPAVRVKVDPDKKWVYTPQDPEAHYGRFGHLVTVVSKHETGMVDSSDNPVFRFVVSFCEDGYKAYAYEDELEEV